jgi:GT2 family glycosyltransferase/glycosyltransferase involved in cell wall biosynthesis
VSRATGSSLREALQNVLGVREDRRPPIVLDWGTGTELDSGFPEAVVFQHPQSEKLPYLPKTVDVVIASKGQSVDEASRVASLAVLVVQDDQSTLTYPLREQTGPGPSFSIIVTAFGQSEMTVRCLQSIVATLPSWFRGEVVVIDDASPDGDADVVARFCASDPRFRFLRNEKNLGYLRSCNRAAAMCGGDYLVFLNNDTLLEPGWFDALRDTFRRYPDAGAVGGKLLYPDGTLQEAGSVLFEDGSAVNVGKLDDRADHPLFSFVREVDYCSAAFISTPRVLFAQLGGMDERFAPLYYEDADYCFKVKATGHRVLYQPACRVVHIEGATCGDHAANGMKLHQVHNRRKFAAKWETAMPNQPSGPQYLDDQLLHRTVLNGTPRVLVLSSELPEHDKEGGGKGLEDILSLLREEGWGVTFAATASKAPGRYARALEQRGIATFTDATAPGAKAPFRTELERLLVNGAFDVVLIFFWHVAHEWGPLVRRLSPRSKVVIHTIDLHFLRIARSVLRHRPADEAPLLDHVYGTEMRLELNAYARADRVIAVSDKESSLIEDFTGRPGFARTVPLLEDIEQSHLGFDDRRGIIFLGSFRHPPNLEAAEYLLREILPRFDESLRREHPLTMIGTDLDDRVRRLADGVEHVELVGWVPSVYPYLERARVSVLPLLHGAGTKNKLIQSVFIGTPTVTTVVATEGLGLEDGVHTLVAGDPAKFANAVATLLTNPGIWKEIAANARAALEHRHGRSAVKESLLDALPGELQHAGAGKGPQRVLHPEKPLSGAPGTRTFDQLELTAKEAELLLEMFESRQQGPLPSGGGGRQKLLLSSQGIQPLLPHGMRNQQTVAENL